MSKIGFRNRFYQQRQTWPQLHPPKASAQAANEPFFFFFKARRLIRRNHRRRQPNMAKIPAPNSGQPSAKLPPRAK